MRVGWENDEWIKRTPPEKTLMDHLRESMKRHTSGWMVIVLIWGVWFYLYGSQVASRLFTRLLWIGD